jgi:hypothetical protein
MYVCTISREAGTAAIFDTDNDIAEENVPQIVIFRLARSYEARVNET